MRTTRAALVALLVVGACLVIAEPASACPPPDEGQPCDLQPWDPLPGQCDWKVSKTILYCLL